MFETMGEAFIAAVASAMQSGDLIEVRGSVTRELRNQALVMKRPTERTPVIAGRRNNIFASIAETMWLLGGRDDIAFLTPYIPRAVDFSDDGEVWRAAYGPRLRSWGGVDQVDNVVRLLNDDPHTRRAIIALFDPAADYTPSKDVPCTNWLQFTTRDGALHLTVVMRSNDLFWGFSGINVFEWSVLQEMVARWTGHTVGTLTFFVGSLHIYERHFERARAILGHPRVSLPPSAAPRSAFNTGFDELNQQLALWFRSEQASRLGQPSTAHEIADPLLRDYAAMVSAFWAFNRSGRGAGEAALQDVADAGLVAAGLDYLAWKSGDESDVEFGLNRDELRDAVIALHRVKDLHYGPSWKKRGERTSILPNIARKLDRLAFFDSASDAIDEPWLDTSVDLLVYAVKYVAFLRDQAGVPGPPDMGTWSDGPTGFEQLLPDLLAQNMPGNDVHEESVHDLVRECEDIFVSIEAAAEARSELRVRQDLAASLASAAVRVVLAVAAVFPGTTAVELSRWKQIGQQEAELFA
ncbi:thymidylate synthase [Microbacterium sp. WCS2018Hpa-9]|uniref:thymidylate synthase n=1 Tax=Microbacterium sp. WCS2018Hpa-9 TaxID=3073635 RepID=UPI00288A88B1|nr:thymidylate synthase [Microbacterium sp. WCS2018Hpa-9]